MINSTLIILIVVMILIVKAVKIVPIGYEWVVEDFGKCRESTLKPGVNIVIPIVSRVRNKVSMNEQTMELPPQPVKTAENITILVKMVVFYKIIDPIMAVNSTEDIRRDLASKIQLTAINVAKEKSVDEILSARDDFSKEIQNNFVDVNEVFGCGISRIEIVNIKLPKDLEEMYIKKKTEENTKLINNIFHSEKLVGEKENINNNIWCEKSKKAWETKKIDDLIILFDNKVRYYKDSMTRLYSLNEIKEEWLEIINEDYRRIDIKLEMEEGTTFMVNIKADERITHNIVAKVELNPEGKCIYFKKWEENL